MMHISLSGQHTVLFGSVYITVFNEGKLASADTDFAIQKLMPIVRNDRARTNAFISART